MPGDSMNTITSSARPLALAVVALMGGALLARGGSKPEPTPPPQTKAEAAAPVSAEAKTAAEQITGDYLRAQITKFSGDEFEGRGPATPGDTKAREYLVDQLKQLGFAPGGADGSYQQVFDVVGITAEMPKQWSFKKGGNTVSFK